MRRNSGRQHPKKRSGTSSTSTGTVSSPAGHGSRQDSSAAPGARSPADPCAGARPREEEEDPLISFSLLLPFPLGRGRWEEGGEVGGGRDGTSRAAEAVRGRREGVGTGTGGSEEGGGTAAGWGVRRGRADLVTAALRGAAVPVLCSPRFLRRLVWMQAAPLSGPPAANRCDFPGFRFSQYFRRLPCRAYSIYGPVS